MYAMLLGNDGHLHWTQVPDLDCADDGVILKIYAAGMNHADVLQRAGKYPAPDGWPDWFGLEVAGVITAVGEKTAAAGRWHVGDRVCALLGGGGYAEYAAVPSSMLLPIPKGLSMEEAAALPEAYGAGYLFLNVEGKVKEGDTVLMMAGAGGVASVIIPMAKAFGARVITTVLDDDQEKAAEHLHPDRIINTSREKIPDVLAEEKEAGRGVDIAIDCLGGETAGACLPLMNHGGRWIIIATLADDFTRVDLRKLYVNGTRLIGTTLRSRSPEEKGEILDSMTRILWPKVESGEIRPTIYKIFPMMQAEEALDLMTAGKNHGKMILTVTRE